MTALRIFHTADWHLGKNFGTFDRTDDFRLFLDDFLALVSERRPDVILIAGDIFDTSMPSAVAQTLYYDFIGRLSQTDVALTVITAGNHDSQRFLEAPNPLLRSMRCVVAGPSPEEEAVLFMKNGRPALGIAAVPYLREADVRAGNLDYSDADRAELFEKGVFNRYRAVRDRLRQSAAGADIPMIAMGHLFVTGSRMKPDGLPDTPLPRESVHVGSLRNVTQNAFGQDWDYIALGHIHNSQKVSNAVPTYYSGSPLALSFGHRHYKHVILEINIDEQRRLDVIQHPVRQPRRFITLSGSFSDLMQGIRDAGALHDGQAPLIEAKLTSTEIVDNLVDRLQKAGDQAGVHVMTVRNETLVRRLLDNEKVGFDLTHITPEEVFKCVLHERTQDKETADALYEEFKDMFAEIKEEALQKQRASDLSIEKAL